MGQFLKDLADGKEFEHQVLEIAHKEFPSETWELNTERKGVDIISQKYSIEAKYDRMSSSTGNLFIEISCNERPSGINAYENITVYAYGTTSQLFLFNTERLKLGINSKIFRRIKGGDGWRSQGVLLPIKVAAALASKIIKLGQ